MSRHSLLRRQGKKNHRAAFLVQTVVKQQQGGFGKVFGTGHRTRTYDTWIMIPLLYQLS